MRANRALSDELFAPIEDGIPKDEVHVWCVTLDERPQVVEHGYSVLSPDERGRADLFRFPSLRADFVLSRAILRALLARFCGRAPAEIVFEYGERGKPALGPGDCPLRFNVSHSGRIGAYALSMNSEVGVDVEHRRFMPDLQRIAERFFSPAERCELMDVAEPRREAAFFDCWVRKEAYIKALGDGLAVPLDSFRVSLTPGWPAALMDVRADAAEAREWSIREFAPAPGYAGAVAFRSRHGVVRVHSKQASTILQAAGVLSRKDGDPG